MQWCGGQYSASRTLNARRKKQPPQHEADSMRFSRTCVERNARSKNGKWKMENGENANMQHFCESQDMRNEFRDILNIVRRGASHIDTSSQLGSRFGTPAGDARISPKNLRVCLARKNTPGKRHWRRKCTKEMRSKLLGTNCESKLHHASLIRVS